MYGPIGSGKTTLLCSAVDVPDMNDVLHVDAEAGDMVTEDNDRIKNVAAMSSVRVTNITEIARVQEYLKAHCILRDRNDVDRLRANESWLTGVPVEDIKIPKRFKTVIIDTLTEVEQYNFYGLMGVNDDLLIGSEAENVEVATWDTFRKNNMMIQKLIRAFRDLPMNLLIACHQAYTQDELKRQHYNLALTGKLATQIGGLVDIVGFLQVAQTPDEKGRYPRRLCIQPTGRFAAKNRRAAFKEPHIEDPTMMTIMKATGLLK